ncbi:hypothetical protein [Herpetosiphon llansteffanensis]|uniref:hypothetical protein n=1 Tax=Herpetosiphon llansteffanensis TaxID=2094568 RepID=UPI000D7C9385|nr:hypothetical protein [Herpetosiphon llansteffanensis]
MKSSLMRLVGGSLLVLTMLLPTATWAADSANIYASCGNGAWVSIGGSGSVQVTFNRLGASSIVKNINLGGGMSTVVYSGVAGSYSTVSVNGNSSISGAGCA